MIFCSIQLAAHAQGGGPDLARAERLIGAGQAEEAWRLLSPHEFTLAGSEQFDYLLGVAALETGRADLATLIFERVLAVNPNHAGARLDMGRAYFALGDFERARVEFDSVLRFDPPPAAREAVERYMKAMQERRTSPRAAAGMTAYIEAVAGHDSNVNAATSQSSIFIPLFGVSFNLASSSTSTRDTFTGIGAGADGSYAVGRGFAVLGGADVKLRAHPKAGAYDFTSGDARTGIQYTGERDLLRATVSRNDYRLDGAAYRRINGAGLEWRRALDARTQLSLFGQDSRIRYLQSSAQSNSSNLVLYGVTAARTFDEATRSVVYAGVFGGTDSATDSRTDGDRKLYGVRGGVQRAFAAAVDLFANVSYQKSDYELQNIIFSASRNDRQFDLSLGITWQPATLWLVRPQLGYTRNDSTLSLNDYRRYEASITLRRDWR